MPTNNLKTSFYFLLISTTLIFLGSCSLESNNQNANPNNNNYTTTLNTNSQSYTFSDFGIPCSRIFEPGKSEIINYKDELNKIAKKIQEASNIRIKIHGYTDNQNDEEENLKLSLDRAKSIKDFLILNNVNSDKIIEAKGLGSENPIYPNEDKVEKKQNHRIVFIIEK